MKITQLKTLKKIVNDGQNRPLKSQEMLLLFRIDVALKEYVNGFNDEINRQICILEFELDRADGVGMPTIKYTRQLVALRNQLIQL